MGNVYDICIIGCGPAGLSAAINAKNKNRKLIVLGSEICSPPMHKAPMITNYLGFPSITGEELRQRFIGHASSMGIDIVKTKADNVFPDGDEFIILAGENTLQAKTVIICTGVPYRSTIKGETDYLGKGLGYCATCDGPLYTGKDVAIIAHNEEAEPEANYLSEICRRVYYIPLYKGEPAVNPSVEVLKDKPREVQGDQVVRKLILAGGELEVDGVFIVGAETSPDRLIPGLEMDGIHIKVDSNMETSIPGIYAAGDCTGQPYQLAKAVGQGQVAGLNAAKRVLTRG